MGETLFRDTGALASAMYISDEDDDKMHLDVPVPVLQFAFVNLYPIKSCIIIIIIIKLVFSKLLKFNCFFKQTD